MREGLYVGTIHPDGGKDATLVANPFCRSLFGFTADAPEASVRPFAPERFVDRATRGTMLEALLRDHAICDYLVQMRREDGSRVWVEITAEVEPLGGRGVRELQLTALLRDVSERRKLDERSRQVYSQLVQAERMAALGRTMADVAHELRNPLATILSWAERLADRRLDPAATRGVEAILASATSASRIVKQLLQTATKRQTTRRLVDLNELVWDTLALRAHEQRGMNISVVTSLGDALPGVLVDAHQIQQVLLNLVVNAEQAMSASHGRGTLRLRTYRTAERGMVAIEVSDDGPGVPLDMQDRIFEPFFTTKAEGVGTGLGLAVTQAIVQEHGGRIRLESQGGGATFVVELLAHDLPAPSEAGDAAAGAARSVVGTRALLVEDENALAGAVIDALGSAGLTVEHATDGAQALALIRERVYNLVICDLKMPGMDGMAFYRAIAAAAPELARRVIFVTGAVAGDEATRFLEETGCRWLAKPFRLADLLTAVRATVG